MASYSLYGNIDDSNNISNLLADYYRSCDYYDPFADYAIFRTSQNDYFLCYGDLVHGGDYKTVHYNNNQQLGQYSISFGSGSDFALSTNGYHFVGSIDGASHSSTLDSYKTSSIIVICLSVVVVLVLFNIFRKHKPDFTRSGITVR